MSRYGILRLVLCSAVVAAPLVVAPAQESATTGAVATVASSRNHRSEQAVGLDPQSAPALAVVTRQAGDEYGDGLPPVSDVGRPHRAGGTDEGIGRYLGDDHEGYEGGRGLITLEGISGMFLNPTSGTLPAGSLTVQYCAALLERNDHTDYQHTAMASYGVTDWLELGAFGRINAPADGPDIGGGGPLARARILKDRDWVPELSVGGLIRDGNQRLEKRTAFAAASKRLRFEENALLLSLRGHVGFRQLWQDSEVAEANGSVVYGGIELEMPYDFWLVGELSNNADVFTHQPYGFGLQWRPTRVVGLSLAGVQTGGEDAVSFYAGIGATLSFD